jgi:SecD/SecF fusion protein
MDKHALWKWIVLIVAVSLSLAFVMPPKEKLRLGLDLQGGSSFTVQIDRKTLEQEIRATTPDASDAQISKRMSGAQARSLEVLRNRIDNLGISEPEIYGFGEDRIIIQLPGIDEKLRAEAEKSIKSAAFMEFRMVHADNDKLVTALFDKNVAPEGYMVAGGGEHYVVDPKFNRAKVDREYRERLGRFNIPGATYEFMLEKVTVNQEVQYRPYFVSRLRELTGDSLKNANVDFNMMEPVVKIEFDRRGAKKFAQVTGDYAPGGRRNPNPQTYRQLAIIMDSTLYSAPRINEAIFGGKAEISGNFTPTEATFLENVLRAGSLPVPVEIIETRSVAPSLGQESIRSGVTAVAMGGMAVLLFMVGYYLKGGIVANVALLLNVILLPLGMLATAGFMGIFLKDAPASGMKLPVLTLPGIAGIALTVGMAVDANVLIFERIREELRSGKRLMSAIMAGYDRAFSAIFDSNLTTILSGVIMFIFGSGPIRGYAVTLCAGIIISMFTAIIVTKLILVLWVERGWLKSLPMLSILKSETKIDFMGKRAVAIGISLVIILGSWAYMGYKAHKNPGAVFSVDFVGGVGVTFTAEKPLGETVISKALADAGVQVSAIQQQNELNGSRQFIQVTADAAPINGEKASDVISSTMLKAFPENKLIVSQIEDVGAKVSSDLKRQALWALGLAIVGMIIYISMRFEFGFALGAIVALIHDVLIAVGIYVVLGRQLNMQSIAVLLTIIGFSINDTIVIFDRVREDVKLVRNMSFVNICNLSINQTLSRTLLTTFTVMITVIMLLVFGGGAIYDFSLLLFIGLIAGTYSTVFIASPVTVAWYRGKMPDFKSTASTKTI